jgi:hypothetical protein
MAAIVVGAGTYLAVHFTPGSPPLSAILFALPASVAAMWLGGRLGAPERPEMIAEIARLHEPGTVPAEDRRV